MSGLCLLLSALFAWCALAPGNVHTVDRVDVRYVQTGAGR